VFVDGIGVDVSVVDGMNVLVSGIGVAIRMVAADEQAVRSAKMKNKMLFLFLEYMVFSLYNFLMNDRLPIKP
jgi:hypothetical protein